ncbi:hypothetical protein [Flavobacterium sp.]|uniref:hypothetical protein n=1 Tax=Flavobacterium sp. TaxID=239 RepID=UPI0037508898
MKIYTFILLLVSSVTFAQASLNDYQYAILPAKFKFQKEKNQYRINATTKAFFEQKGLKVFYDDDVLSQELANNNCNKVYINIDENNNMFTTKLIVSVIDCQNNALLTSKEGSSRIKEYAPAYNEALQIALKSIQDFIYQYKAKTEQPNSAIITNSKAEAKTDNSIQVYFEMQTSSNGFNFLHSKTKAVLNLMKTTSPNYFIAKSDNKMGIVFQKDQGWFFEYYINQKLISEQIELKF